MAINGSTINIGTPAPNVAIDSGTTLVGGPNSVIADLYSHIPGAAAAGGANQGYYTFPCDTQVGVSLTFGGVTYNVSPADFNLGTATSTSGRGSHQSNECLGGFFELGDSAGSLDWIIGDTFLKNVYSVFRYNPPSVGFAQLSSTAQASVGTAVPSSVATQVSGGISGNSAHGDVHSRITSSFLAAALVGVVGGAAAALGLF